MSAAAARPPSRWLRGEASAASERDAALSEASTGLLAAARRGQHAPSSGGHAVPDL